MSCCVRLLNQDYSQGDHIAQQLYSSQDSSFPNSNLYDIYRRQKVWRTSGYYNIESGSNTIVFRETVGTDLTATIAVDEYTSFSAFAAAVKAALEDAGDSTYSVTQATDKRIVITSNGSGGGGIFQPRFATSTAMAAILGFPSTNLTGALAYTADLVSLHTSEWLKWDMGVPLNPTDFVIAAARNDFLKISPSAVIKIQGNNTDNWTAPSCDITLDFNDRLLMEHNEDGLHTAPLRYWRFYIEDKQNPNGYLEFNLVFIGISTDLDRGAAKFPLRVNAVDRSVTTLSEAGTSYTDKRPKACLIEIDWNGLTNQDREELNEVFEDFGTHKPFFLMADPNAVFSTTKEVFVRWCKFSDSPVEELISPANWAMSMSLREEI